VGIDADVPRTKPELALLTRALDAGGAGRLGRRR
jgi:hypothetical protein